MNIHATLCMKSSTTAANYAAVMLHDSDVRRKKLDKKP